MSSNRATPDHPVKFYRIPEEVIKAWERGDYFTGGVPSLAYKHLGVALWLRGLYTYERKTGQDFRGIARIELAGGLNLAMAGIRFWFNNTLDVKFWKTEFSHFLSENKIIWTYRLFECDSQQQLWAHLDGIQTPDITGSHATTLGFRPDDWQRLQQFLLTDEFEEELRAAEARCTTPDKILTIMLHFDIQEGGEIVAQYRKLRLHKQDEENEDDQDVAGDSLFKRLK